MMKWQVNFMQNMEMILNRAYDKPFYKTKTYRKAVKKMDRFLKPYDILVEGKSDVDCFEKEIGCHPICAIGFIHVSVCLVFPKTFDRAHGGLFYCYGTNATGCCAIISDPDGAPVQRRV